MTNFSLPLRFSARRLLGSIAALLALAYADLALAEPLRLAVSRTPMSLPVLVAQERGFFAAEGVNVVVQDCIGGYRCLKQILQGEADLATSGDLPIVFNSFERADFVVLATICTNREDVKLLAHERSGVGKPADLVGKRIGYTHGSASHYFLDLFLMSAGIDPKTVTRVRLPPEEMTAALEIGRIDAAAIWEPFAYETSKALGGKIRLVKHEEHYLGTFNIVAARALVRTRDADLIKVLKAIERSQQFIADHPAESKEILRKRLALDSQFVDHLWPTWIYRNGLDPSLLRTLEAEARWAEREGHVTGKRPANFLDFIESGPLSRAKPGAVAIVR